MDAVNRNIHLLLNSIQKSDVYRTYKKQEAILEKNPELVSRVQHFRSDNFRLQNEERGNLLQDAEQLARESAELRRNPEVNAYPVSYTHLVVHLQISVTETTSLSHP